ncbi:winged helix-turn-helix domain-containing protein [Oceanitalea stevensii]|uniref:YcaQ family DNA glycosylase n=1 Tax=Oceanitalea stevensii TaxID=2763072 RepID=A0ABR8Z483_9MICO|nr:crosslink repair DNA glycosylase YcaQ family protein [Oceanitalea stevensii]MBD8063054.1 YcaQ family DNA glycosylase [Oceanitalea stevensii]
MTRTLSLAQARRVAIAAQGLDRPRPQAVTMRHLTGTLERLGLLQIDSVNVLARAHLLPLLARLGPYDTALVDRASGRAPRRMVEAWAHEASYLPVETYPLVAGTRRRWAGMDPAVLEERHPGLLALVRDVVAERGPLTGREVEALVDARYTERGEGWGWRWSAAKTALETLFDAGELTAARRNAQFERVYDLTERVLPPHVRDRPLPAPEDAVRELVRISARAHGVGTLRCLADYFRLGQRVTRLAVDELVDAGELLPVTVAGWDRPAWVHAAARVPRRTPARALLAPFDPLVFERRRLLELFGMHYRIGIYTPAHLRTHGYYVLPFLLGEHLVARVDLKHDRDTARLLVRSAFLEQPRAGDAATWPAPAVVVAELAAELATMARWLGAHAVVVDDAAAGDLARPLGAELDRVRLTDADAYH